MCRVEKKEDVIVRLWVYKDKGSGGERCAPDLVESFWREHSPLVCFFFFYFFAVFLLKKGGEDVHNGIIIYRNIRVAVVLYNLVIVWAGYSRRLKRNVHQLLPSVHRKYPWFRYTDIRGPRWKCLYQKLVKGADQLTFVFWLEPIWLFGVVRFVEIHKKFLVPHLQT